MKQTFKRLVKKYVMAILNWLAAHRLKRLKVFAIGVTGSVGKTSTKEAIFTVLQKRFQVYRSEKSYNTAFGLPLTILQQASGYNSPWLWFKTMIGALWHAFVGGRHLQMLILEMGVDAPGDMDQLLKLVVPQVSVLTSIKPVHMADGQFKTLDDIFTEKRKLIDALPEKGIAVLNADDPYISSMYNQLSCRTLWYGARDGVDLQASDIVQNPEGLAFTLRYKDEMAHAQTKLLGKFQIYVLMPAIAVALTQGFTLQEAVDALDAYHLPPGRMSLIEGVKGSTIIDSSYNASPEAVRTALDALAEMPAKRRIAVLGNMNELGAVSESHHRHMGGYATERTNILITVGDYARWMHEEAAKVGMPKEMLHHFQTAYEAADFIKPFLQEGDVVLVKGSQNKVRLERLVKKIMLYPGKAAELLCRQEDIWQHID